MGVLVGPSKLLEMCTCLGAGGSHVHEEAEQLKCSHCHGQGLGKSESQLQRAVALGWLICHFQE